MGRKAAVAVAVVLLSWSGQLRAGSLNMFGASSRGTAMGGAMVSIAQGWEAVHYNPSALALSRESTSFEYISTSGEMLINEENSLGSSAMKFGLNRRLLRDRIGLGLLVGTSPVGGGGGLSLDLGALTGGGGGFSWQMYQDSMPLLLNFGISFRLTNWLSVGASFEHESSLVSVSYFPVPIDALMDQIGIITGFVPSNVEATSFSAGADPDSEFNTGFNISFRPIKYISLGYLYKPVTWARYKIRVELMGGPGATFTESQYIMIDMKVPGQVETTVYGGAGHIPLPWNDGTLTVAYAREMQAWDDFYPRSAMYQWSAPDVYTDEFFTGPQPRDPGLEDIEIDRYGLEYEGDASPMLFWKFKDLKNARFAVRGGYYQWESPQPQAKFAWQVAMVDSDSDVFSFGLGFGWDRKKGKLAAENPDFPPRLEINIHAQHMDIEERNYYLEPDEYQRIPLENYQVRTEASVTQVGFQLTWLR